VSKRDSSRMFTLLNTLDIKYVFTGPNLLVERCCFYLERKHLGYHQHNYLIFDMFYFPGTCGSVFG
jgi:hypothetical protein